MRQWEEISYRLGSGKYSDFPYNLFSLYGKSTKLGLMDSKNNVVNILSEITFFPIKIFLFILLTPAWTRVNKYVQGSALFLHIGVILFVLLGFPTEDNLYIFAPIPATSGIGWLYAIVVTILLPIYMTFIGKLFIPIVIMLVFYYLYVTVKRLWFNPIIPSEKGYNSKNPLRKPYKIEAYISSGDKAEDVKLKSTEYFFTKEEAIRWAMDFDCTEASLTEVTTGNHVIVKLNGKKTTTQGWDGRAEWLIER